MSSDIGVNESPENSRGRERIKSQLYEAAWEGHLEEVIKLSAGYVDNVDELRWEYLKLCSAGSLDDNVDVLSETLIRSSVKGHLDVVRWLVERALADVNYRSGWTPLTAACGNGQLEVVKYLLTTSKIDVNLPDIAYGGDTPLIWACYSVHTSVALFMLNEVSFKLEIDIADGFGNTALHHVVWRSQDDGNTPLHKACETGDVAEVRKLMLDSYYMINVQNNAGNTPLHWACRYGHCDIVETLILAGANETIINDEGMTPEQLAVSRGHGKLLELLDRDKLWIRMVQRTKLKKMASCFLVMLALSPVIWKTVGRIKKEDQSSAVGLLIADNDRDTVIEMSRTIIGERGDARVDMRIANKNDMTIVCEENTTFGKFSPAKESKRSSWQTRSQDVIDWFLISFLPRQNSLREQTKDMTDKEHEALCNVGKDDNCYDR